ncbi:GGDEF domain-containing protein [Desulfobacula sp.]|uniref:GGDEF domain-containing protein n=1 Tax=Desulfobacula sp. TaxID=2593537 RepID=UPI0026260C6D|nr:GGDEF domain-containing protein [Desulfobacula sp.]
MLNLMLPLESDIKRVLNLEIKEIPSFPPVMAKLLKIFSDADADMEDLSKLVETDPGISTRVLGLANASLYGLNKKITAVSEAAIHLGFDEVKKISLGITVFEKMVKSKSRTPFDRRFFWRHCLCVATLSMAIAEGLGYPNPGEAYTCGLLHDLGKILFDLQGRVNYGDFIATVTKHTGPLITEERELMGMGHDDLGAYYSSLWDLPAPLALTISHHHRRYGHLDLSQKEALLISIVSLANFLSWTQGMGSIDIIRPPILQPEVEKNIDLTTIDFKKIIHRLDREMENTSRFYGFTFPSASQFRENLLRANLQLCTINTTYYYPETRQAKPVEVSKIKESITSPHRSLDPKAIITATLKAIYKDFKFNRLYVMKVVKNLRSLKVIEFFDASDTGMDLKSIEISIDKTAGGFVDCLRDKVPVMITGRTSGEQKTLMEFNIKEMVIVPFCSHNKVMGILGMDNIASEKAILPDVVSSIAIVANELGIAMENAITYKEAKAISLKDGLTGLLNRLAIDELLAKSFRKAVEGKNKLCLVMVDVDYFKKFNDTFGHQAGDNILKLIATTLKKLSRPFDHVGRYGGEEFIIILNNTNLSNALVYAERIRREIEQLGRLLANRFPGLSLTVSAGVSEYQTHIKTRDDLIKTADTALYQAKETGRNKVASG